MKQRSGVTGRSVVTGGTGSGQARALDLLTVVLASCAVLAGAGLILLSCLGAWWPVFDIAAHVTWHALGALIGGGLALILASRNATKFAFGSLIVMALATVSLPVLFSSLSTWERAQWSTPPAEGSVRIVSLNTWHANTESERTISFLENVHADVVFLAEFGPPKRRWLNKLKTHYPHQIGCAERFHCAVQVVSRHPIAQARVLSRDNGTGPPSVHLTLGGALRGLRLIGVHLMRPIDSYRGNLREVNQIARLARASRGSPTIVVGDFNLTAWSWNFDTFRKASGLRHMDKHMPTWPTGGRGWPQLAIDHAFASPDITFRSVGLGPDVGSDHKPIIIDVKLPGAVP